MTTPDDDKVLVRAKGTALVPYPHPDPRSDDTRRKIGRVYKETAPGSGRWAFHPTDQAERVAKQVEIARHIADGDLFPGDEAAATWACSVTRASVKFDPAFGGAPAKSDDDTGDKDGDK